MTAIKATVLSLLLSTASGAAIKQRQAAQPAANPWPFSYTAMGDSYASGVGAGKFFASDEATKKCERFTGSYPAQVAELIPSIRVDKNSSFDFVACSGDELPELAGQHEKLKRQTADVVTLSIGGNDFGFKDVINACIYNYVTPDDSTKDAACSAALDAAQALVNADVVWDNYNKEVTKILTENLSELKESFLIITGYMKFFAADEGDHCGWRRFMIPGVDAPTNILHKTTRDRMNSIVDQVNKLIQEKVVAPNSAKVEFVDIDPFFEGHRFCETTQQLPIPSAIGDGDNDNVWVISLVTTLEEKASTTSARGPDKLLLRSAFHPKAAAHNATAHAVASLIQNRQSKFL